MSEAPTTAPAALVAAGAVVRAVVGPVRTAARAVRWYAREMSGEAAYDRYVAAHTREHPGHPPASASQWWRRRAAEQEDQVHTGCC